MAGATAAQYKQQQSVNSQPFCSGSAPVYCSHKDQNRNQSKHHLSSFFQYKSIQHRCATYQVIAYEPEKVELAGVMPTALHATF
jgi:hypothetical protein